MFKFLKNLNKSNEDNYLSFPLNISTLVNSEDFLNSLSYIKTKYRGIYIQVSKKIITDYWYQNTWSKEEKDVLPYYLMVFSFKNDYISISNYFNSLSDNIKLELIKQTTLLKEGKFVIDTNVE